MRFAIDFDCQPGVTTKEVQNVGTGRVLAAKLETIRALPEPMP